MENLKLTDRVAALAEPLLSSLGLILWGIEYFPGARAVIRIYIETAGESGAPAGDENSGAGIDECSRASRLIGLALEVEDFIPSSYVLEVSTPGLERRFFKPGQLAAALGRRVEINLAEAARPGGRKKYAGRLAGARLAADGGWLFDLDLDAPASGEETRLTFPWSGLKRAGLLYEPPVKEKPGKKACNKRDG